MSNPSMQAGKFHGRVVAATLLLLTSINLHAQLPMAIVLKGDAEVPAVKTAATGSGQFTVLADQTVIGSIKTVGLVPTVAHIHEGVLGKNGPPIVVLTKAGADGFVVPDDARLTDSQYASFRAGALYVNVHSAQYPDGEIRGQLIRMEIADTPVRPPD
jgi:hypothetical protein